LASDFLDQPRLPDASLADDEETASMAGDRLLETRAQLRELALSTHEEPSGRRHRERSFRSLGIRARRLVLLARLRGEDAARCSLPWSTIQSRRPTRAALRRRVPRSEPHERGDGAARFTPEALTPLLGEHVAGAAELLGEVLELRQ